MFSSMPIMIDLFIYLLDWSISNAALPPAAVVSMHRWRSWKTCALSGLSTISGMIGPTRRANARENACPVSVSPHQMTAEKPAAIARSSGTISSSEIMARPPNAFTAAACFSASSRVGPAQSRGSRGIRRRRFCSPVGPGSSSSTQTDYVSSVCECNVVAVWLVSKRVKRPT